MASAKLDELPNILNELDGKVIIWSRYVNSLENIISLLKKNYGTNSTVAIYGKTPTKERPKIIEVEYDTTKGTKETARLDQMESKCFQHELDHLEGITFNTRVSKLRWDMAIKKSEKINA